MELLSLKTLFKEIDDMKTLTFDPAFSMYKLLLDVTVIV